MLVYQFDDGLVLYIEHKDYYIGLDEIGIDIWEGISKFGSLKKVIKEMSEIYNVNEATLRDHVEQFCLELVKYGALNEVTH